MSKVKIVDAVSSSPVPAPAPAAASAPMMVSVPIKLDASALAKAMQDATAQTAKANVGEMIKNSAIKIEEIYKRFDSLKLITNELSGKPFPGPLPDTLQIEEIVFRFRVAKAGKVSELTTATVNTVVCVGDIAQLLSSELGSIIVQLEQEAGAVRNIAALTEEASGKARIAWGSNNPDRKFTPVAPEQPETAQTNDANPV